MFFNFKWLIRNKVTGHGRKWIKHSRRPLLNTLEPRLNGLRRDFLLFKSVILLLLGQIAIKEIKQYLSNKSKAVIPRSMSWETLKRPSFIQSNPVLRTPTLYGHLIITDSLLCPWGKKAITLSLKSTRSIWTPRKYGHFLWPSQCPYYRVWMYFIKISSQRNLFLWQASS